MKCYTFQHVAWHLRSELNMRFENGLENERKCNFTIPQNIKLLLIAHKKCSMRIHEGHIVNELDQIWTVLSPVSRMVWYYVYCKPACIRHILEIQDTKNINSEHGLRAVYNVTYCPKSISNVNKWNGKSLDRILFSVNFNIDANRIYFFLVAIGHNDFTWISVRLLSQAQYPWHNHPMIVMNSLDPISKNGNFSM